MTDSNPPKTVLKGDESVSSNIEIVRQSDTKVRVGFFPATTPLSTTNPAELPGSRTTVITAPPGSKVIGERSRAKSIEEASSHLKKYAPEMSKNPLQGEFQDGLIDSGACLGLTSYLSSSMPESTGDSGRGSSLAKKSPRKASIAASTTSVSCTCLTDSYVELCVCVQVHILSQSFLIVTMHCLFGYRSREVLLILTALKTGVSR